MYGVRSLTCSCGYVYVGDQFHSLDAKLLEVVSAASSDHKCWSDADVDTC